MRTVKHSTRIRSKQAGFTIIELMIATLVFSIILVVVTFGVIHFTNAYYQGINSSTTQTTARGIVDNITQAIEFSGDTVFGTSATSNFFCAGSDMYVYTLGKQLTAAPTIANRGLYEFTNPSPGSCNLPSPVPANGTELIGKKIRVAALSVTNSSTDLWQVSLSIVYGDSDLLCNRGITNPSTKGSCAAGAPNYSSTDLITGTDVTCKTQIGSQFCAVSNLTTTAEKRVD